MSAQHPLSPLGPPTRRQLGRMMLFTALAMLALAVLGVVLTLPGDVSPEGFLGLGSANQDELQAIVAAWLRLNVFSSSALRVDLAHLDILYLCVDTIFFIPLYGALFLEIALRSGGFSGRLLAGLTCVTMSVDLVENASGLAKLAQVVWSPGNSWTGWLAVVAAAAAPAIGYWFWNRQTAGYEILAALSSSVWRSARTRWRQAMFVALVIIGATLLAVVFDWTPTWVMRISVASHAGKLVFEKLLLGWLLVMGVAWLFVPGKSRADLATIRWGLFDILLRLRYVLAILGVLIALTLGLDQSRDVLIGIADGMLACATAFWSWLAFLVTVLAVWALSFSSWLWSRLVCRMPGPNQAHYAHISAAADHTLQTAARGIARTLGLVPPFVVAYMSGLSARDAVWAASYAPVGVILTPLLLLAFGAASLLGGLLFLWSRERAGQMVVERYFNDPSLGADWMVRIAAEKYRFIWPGGPTPTSLALLALIVAVLARCLLVLIPTGAPWAVALIILMLTAWLGFLGWLSLKERREARPWSLALIAVAGVLGYVGFADNHIVRVVRTDASGILPTAAAQVAGAVFLLVCVVVTAIVLVHNAIRTQKGQTALLHWGWVLALAAIAAMTVLIAVDRLSYRTEIAAIVSGGPSVSPSKAIGRRATLEQSFTDWAHVLLQDKSAVDGDGKKVFFVASEGGGMRAAYWTARTLQELRREVQDFDKRTFMMSGASGGAVGEAVYAACLRSFDEHKADAVSDAQLTSCLDEFGESDLLTPMVGAWLFEDALARVLPTSGRGDIGGLTVCGQPGCGFMSRGLWFEQALERAVPRLRYGIGHVSEISGSGRVPHLFLNSTWVESGDRAVASSVQVNYLTNFPDAFDQLACAAGSCSGAPGAAVDMPLSAAAHNSGRFTYINAIGLLRDASGHINGHLADGGYFDNSASHTTIDVLAALHVWLGSDQCKALGNDECTWLGSLRPQVLVIENGVIFNCDSEPPSGRLECLRRQWQVASASQQKQPDPVYDARVPATGPRLRLFSDLAGPLVTVVNVGGSGGNGRRAQALLDTVCAQFPQGPVVRGNSTSCVIQIAQRMDGALYPLGWYLSRTARRALDKKASCEVRTQVLHKERCPSDQKVCDCP